MFQNPHQTVLISMKIGLTRGSFSKRLEYNENSK